MRRKDGRRQGLEIRAASSTLARASHQVRPGKRRVEVFGGPAGFAGCAFAGLAVAERFVCFLGFVIHCGALLVCLLPTRSPVQPNPFHTNLQMLEHRRQSFARLSVLG